MASVCTAAAAPTGPVSAALASAGYSLFLSALPLVNTPGGCFLSPLSILYALTLALNGAGPGSSTQTEILAAISGTGRGNALSETEVNADLSRVMELLRGQCAAPGPGSSPGGTSGSGGSGGGAGGAAVGGGNSSQMILANSIWTAPGFQLDDNYVRQLQSLFQATAREAANGAQDVNAWIAGVTQGMITDLIQSSNFTAILANALYFKGLWNRAFDKSLTQPEGFTAAGGANKQVNMMKQRFGPGDKIGYAHKEGAYDAVVLPYKGGAFSAVTLLPAPGVQLVDALRGWASEGAGAVQGMSRVNQLILKMPKFKVSSRMSLTPVLQSLGVRAAFSPGADFSRISNTSKLFISDVLHQAVVEVDEEGTVAAAATAVVLLMYDFRAPPPLEIVFDRPFAFIIHHNPTGLPAFIGAVNDPSAVS